MGEVFPGVAVGAVVFANRPPLALTQVRPPPLPGLATEAVLFQATLLFAYCRLLQCHLLNPFSKLTNRSPVRGWGRASRPEARAATLPRAAPTSPGRNRSGGSRPREPDPRRAKRTRRSLRGRNRWRPLSSPR